MAAVTQAPPARPASAPARARRGRAPAWRWAILLVAGTYFLLPLYAALRFAGIRAYGSVFSQPGFTDALWLSVRLAVITTVITLALMVPTTVYVRPRGTVLVHLGVDHEAALIDAATGMPTKWVVLGDNPRYVTDQIGRLWKADEPVLVQIGMELTADGTHLVSGLVSPTTQMVQARWRKAAPRVPLRRMKPFRGGSSPSYRSMVFSKAVIFSGLTTVFGLTLRDSYFGSAS